MVPLNQPWLQTLAPLTCYSLRQSRASGLRLTGPEGPRRTTAPHAVTAGPGQGRNQGSGSRGRQPCSHTSPFTRLASAVPNPMGHCAALWLWIRSGSGAWKHKANTCKGSQGNLHDLLLCEGRKGSGLLKIQNLESV